MSEYHWATLERRRRIVELVKMIDRKRGMTLPEIMAETGYHKNTILSYLTVMEKNEWVDVYPANLMDTGKMFIVVRTGVVE